MAPALNNAQGELSPLEIGLHALGSRLTNREYAKNSVYPRLLLRTEYKRPVLLPIYRVMPWRQPQPPSMDLRRNRWRRWSSTRKDYRTQRIPPDEVVDDYDALVRKYNELSPAAQAMAHRLGQALDLAFAKSLSAAGRNFRPMAAKALRHSPDAARLCRLLRRALSVPGN